MKLLLETFDEVLLLRVRIGCRVCPHEEETFLRSGAAVTGMEHVEVTGIGSHGLLQRVLPRSVETALCIGGSSTHELLLLVVLLLVQQLQKVQSRVANIGDILRRVFLLWFVSGPIEAIHDFDGGEHVEDGIPVVILLAAFVVMQLEDLQFGE